MSDQGGARGMRESDGAARMIGSGAAEGRAKMEQTGQSRWFAFDIGGDITAEPPKQHDKTLQCSYMSSLCIAYGNQHIHNP